MNPRNLIIEPVLNGFVVQVGCQRVVFDSPAKLGAHITEYYTNPSKVEHEFLKNKVNDTMSGPAMPEPIREPRAQIERLNRDTSPIREEVVNRACEPTPTVR